MALRALVSTVAASRSISFLLASRRAFATTTRYVPLLRCRPLLALSDKILPSTGLSSGSGLKCFSTNRTASSLNDPSPNWSNRPPKETILLDGCDFEHWLVVVDPPDPNLTRDEIIKSYIQTLSKVIGSEEEARFKIYSVSTKHYFAFGALISEELSYKMKEIPGVRWVLPDSYLDVRNKDYGGEPFINGEAVPYDPKYHEEWVRNNARANERNRRNDRPRNHDRSRNFERRRENVQNFENRPPQPPSPMPGQNQATQGVPPIPNAMPRDAGNPGYQNQMPNFQGNPPNSQSGGYQGPPGNRPFPGPSNAYQGGSGGYQGPPPNAAYQSGQGGYQGAPTVHGGGPAGYPGIPSAGPQGYPATLNSPQGGPGAYQGGPGGYQGGSGGYQGPPNAYQGGPGGYQGPGNSYHGGGSGNPYTGTPNSAPGGPGGYQGAGNSFQGTPNSPPGGPGALQDGGITYPGRDVPGRDQ